MTTTAGLLRCERGLTSLAEAMTVLGLLGLVLSAFYGATYSMWNQVGIVEARQAANDEVRAAVIQLQNEIRSGNVFTDPATFSSPDQSLRLVIYTQNRAGSFGDANLNRCAEWLVTADDQLKWRWWHPQWDPDGDGLSPVQVVTPWSVVAKHVVNRDHDDDPATPAVPAFSRSGATPEQAALFGYRTITIDLRVLPPGTLGEPVKVTFSVTGRNTEYGYPVDVCSNRPPDTTTS